MKSTLDERIEELERGLLSAGEVPLDVAQTTRTWLDSTAGAMGGALARAAPISSAEKRSLTAPTEAARVRRSAIGLSRDVAWLCATARAGGLLERRAAFLRLTHLAPRIDRGARSAVEALLGKRHASELGLDEMRLCIALSGTGAKAARERLEAVQALVDRFTASVRAFVEGGTEVEPLDALSQEGRSQLLLYLRVQRAEIAAYVASEVERGLTAGAFDALIDLLGALRPAADRRMVPTLARAMLDDPRPDVRRTAASALCRIDDPRVPRALGAAWQRATDVTERLVLAEGLGLWSDRRGIDDVRAALDESDELIQNLALYALAALADADLAERAYVLALESRSREIRIAAVRAVGRAADARGLPWLEAIERRERLPEVLSAAVAMAKDAILARLEARGEVPPARYERRADPLERALARPPGAPATRTHRLLARWTLVRARIARIFGRSRSAANAYARAAAIDPTFVLPPLIEARWRLATGDLVEAVRCFRRLITLDASALCRRPRDLAHAVQALLRRADDLEHQGRHEMAREIHEELFGLDLTSCAASLRVEVRRRRDRRLLAARGDPGISGPWQAQQPEAT